MEQDLNRIFLLAYHYYHMPYEYRSRVDVYDLNGSQLLGFLQKLIDSSANRDALRHISFSTGKSVEDLHCAGLSFVKSVLFNSDRDYYQILGVRHDADADTLRRQYHALIRLFHPDKNSNSDIYDERYSLLINQAYNTLKKPVSRKSYDQDQTIKLVQEVNGKLNTGSHKIVGSYDDHAVKSRKYFNKIQFFKVYPGLAILILMFVIIVPVFLWWGESDSDRYADMAYRVADSAPLPHNLISPSAGYKNNQRNDKSESEDLQYFESSLNSRKLKEILAPDVHSKNTFSISEMGFDGGPISDINDALKIIDTRLSEVSDSDKAFSGPPPELLLLQYVKEYESGDLQKLLELFSSNVITNQGSGKSVIRDNYGSLFRETSNRSLSIKEISIKQRNRAGTILVSKIEAEVQRQDEPDKRKYNGDVVFRVVNNHEGMQIAEMLHSVR